MTAKLKLLVADAAGKPGGHLVSEQNRARDARSNVLPRQTAPITVTRRQSTIRLLWTLQCLTAATVAIAAWMELGTDPHPALFEALALAGAQRHNLVLAVFGIVTAIAVLDIDMAGIAALVIGLVSLSAIVALILLRRSSLVPLVTLAATLVIAWYRRQEYGEFMRYLRRQHCARLHILCPEDDLPVGIRAPLRDNDAALPLEH
jgi:hypothetical protein